METNGKTILDACCGGRAFYYEKADPRVLYCDIREEDKILCDGRRLVVKPDMFVDFRDMPFPSDTFHLVIFDPPHLVDAGPESWLAKRYGRLPKNGWQDYVAQGLMECWRVLMPGGTLIFKWSNIQVKLCEVLKAIPMTPLLGTRTQAETLFLVFFKDPTR